MVQFYVLFYAPPILLPLALFVIPCFLNWRWLCVYVPVVALALAAGWHDHYAHFNEGFGLAETWAYVILLGGTACAIAGVAARLMMLALRAWGVRWRYAWLPAPTLLTLLIAWPVVHHFIQKYEFRPPSDSCLSQRYPIQIGTAALNLPLAPFFAPTEDGERGPYHFYAPKQARTFCAMQGRSAPMRVNPLLIDFDTGWARQGPWEPALCRQASAWMQPFCAQAVEPRKLGYPDEVWITTAEHPEQSFAPLRSLLERAQKATEMGEIERGPEGQRQWLVRTSAGTPMTLTCRDHSPKRLLCEAIYHPASGLLARLEMRLAPDQAPADILEAERKVAEVLRDLGIGK